MSADGPPPGMPKSVPRRVSPGPFVRKAVMQVRQVLRGPKAAEVVGLSIARSIAAGAGLLSVMAIIRLFPAEESGRFFVFLAAAQFVGGAALSPLLLLALRFGSIHRADADRDAMGRLMLFGGCLIVLAVGLVWLVHPLMVRVTSQELGPAWVFASAVGLAGAIFFLSGLGRANGCSITSFLPDNVLRPSGIAIAALVIWMAGAASFDSLSTGYLVVLVSIGLLSLPLAPWRMAQFRLGDLAAYLPYLSAYGPLFLFGLVSTALITFDILLVSRLADVETVPAYRAAAQYAALLSTGGMLASLVYGPQIAVAHQKFDLAELQRAAKASSRLALTFYLAGILPLFAGPALFELIFGPVGREAWILAIILSAGRFANAWFGSVTIIGNLSGRTILIVTLQAASVLVLLCVGLLLGDGGGAKGVAIAAALATTIWVVAAAFLLQRGLKIRMGIR